jgi:shikimate kinase
MEINEIAETIAERESKDEREEGFRRRTALLISALAMALALTSLGGNKTSKELIGDAIAASDTWAFYQAKSIRQTVTRLAADEVETLLAEPNGSPEARKMLEGRLARYRDNIAHYETESDGSGRKELAAKAETLEHERDRAEVREDHFSLAEGLLQIAIVLASAGVTTGARFLVKAAGVLGLIGVLLAVDAFTLLVVLPI